VARWDHSQLDTLGVSVTRVLEAVNARLATRDEQRRLRLAAHDLVHVLTRRMLTATDQVVEVASDIIIPAADTDLLYEIIVAEHDRPE
jgi:DNA-binding GntR family transcriptional regulator